MFPITHWSLLAKATLRGDALGQKALDDLCRAYREPALRFIQQSWGKNLTDAEDIVQSFFLHFLRERLWRAASAEGNQRFRSLFLVSLRNFACNKYRSGMAKKRGGGCDHDPIELMEHDEQPVTEDETLCFDRAWAENLLQMAMQKVEALWAKRNRSDDFAILSSFLPGAAVTLSSQAAAAKLNMTIESLRTTTFRLREELRKSLREEIAATVAPDEVDEEMRYLQQVLRQRVNSTA